MRGKRQKFREISANFYHGPPLGSDDEGEGQIAMKDVSSSDGCSTTGACIMQVYEDEGKSAGFKTW